MTIIDINHCTTLIANKRYIICNYYINCRLYINRGNTSMFHQNEHYCQTKIFVHIQNASIIFCQNRLLLSLLIDGIKADQFTVFHSTGKNFLFVFEILHLYIRMYIMHLKFFCTYVRTLMCSIIKWNKNKNTLREKDYIFILDILKIYFFLNPLNVSKNRIFPQNISKNARIVLNKHTAGLIN